jgi:hypothetical protein
VLFLSSPLPKTKKKHTNKSSWRKRTMQQQNPPLSLVFGLLVYFISFINDVLVDLCQILFTIFYFISVLVMSSLLCSKVTCVLELLFASYFLWWVLTPCSYIQVFPFTHVVSDLDSFLYQCWLVISFFS